MLTKRIIPCLDIKDGKTVKGVNFENLRDAGDPVELAQRYALEGADELVFLDITATVDNRKTLVELVRRVAAVLDIPFTVGGGIASVADVSALLQAGADKVSVNSAAVRNPGLVDELAREFGSQCIVVAIDTKKAPSFGGGWGRPLGGFRPHARRTQAHRHPDHPVGEGSGKPGCGRDSAHVHGHRRYENRLCLGNHAHHF